MARTIQHYAQKEHPLVLGRGGGFVCGGCGCAGAGPRYRCDACGFHLHELCAACPPAAHFFFHGQHRLAFEPAPGGDDPRDCDICDTAVRGMHYHCRPCGFDVHPVCSLLPAAAVSPLHPEHLVMLGVGAPHECARCGDDCVWRYRCGLCDVSIHPRGLLGTEQTPLNIPKSD